MTLPETISEELHKLVQKVGIAHQEVDRYVGSCAYDFADQQLPEAVRPIQDTDFMTDQEEWAKAFEAYSRHMWKLLIERYGDPIDTMPKEWFETSDYD